MTTLREGFVSEIDAVRADILNMGQITIGALQKSIIALDELDREAAQKIIDEDEIINQLEIDIEQNCVLLIARQQPIAKDLRIVMTGLKITTDLERIGDHARDIAKTVFRIYPAREHVKPLVDIPQMARIASAMVRESLEAYHDLDLEKAQKVFQTDDEVDALYNRVFDSLVELMQREPEKIENGTHLISVARYLERIADHATNIAEWVVYLETGQRVRAN